MRRIENERCGFRGSTRAKEITTREHLKTLVSTVSKERVATGKEIVFCTLFDLTSHAASAVGVVNHTELKPLRVFKAIKLHAD